MCVCYASFFPSVFFCHPTTHSSCEIKHCVPLGVHKPFRSCRMVRKLDKVQNKITLRIRSSFRTFSSDKIAVVLHPNWKVLIFMFLSRYENSWHYTSLICKDAKLIWHLGAQFSGGLGRAD